VFVRTGSSWAEEAYLEASNADPGDQFGSSVGVSGDTTVVGTWREQSSGAASDNSCELVGAAYVLVRSGPTWSQEACLKASNPDDLDPFAVGVAAYVFDIDPRAGIRRFLPPVN
jgi:hypothetical protein